MTPHDGKFVSYLRVSTKRQGDSGLGIEAQRQAVTVFLNGGHWQLVEEFVEVESGKDDRNRPELTKAIDACKLYGATLVIAKLDRLSRDAHFLLGLQKSEVKFVATDMPHANRMTVGVMALVAEQEREAISSRTKAALQAAKARGVKLGNPKPDTAGFNDRDTAIAAGIKGGEGAKQAAKQFAELLRPLLEGKLKHLSANAAAQELNRRGVQTARRGQWTATSVIDVRKRLA
jgi:DNA invertase Pin-like site-specific DNA recombinase